MQLNAFRPNTGYCYHILNALTFSQIYQLEIMKQMEVVYYYFVIIGFYVPASYFPALTACGWCSLHVSSGLYLSLPQSHAKDCLNIFLKCLFGREMFALISRG